MQFVNLRFCSCFICSPEYIEVNRERFPKTLLFRIPLTQYTGVVWYNCLQREKRQIFKYDFNELHYNALKTFVEKNHLVTQYSLSLDKIMLKPKYRYQYQVGVQY